MDNRLILVAGSGRSGTSLLAGILKAFDGYVPQPEVKADESNPAGFGEPQWVVDFHTKLLKSAGVQTSDARPSAWAKTADVSRDPDIQRQLESWVRKEFKNGDHVVVKDPRLLWFIPAWIRAGETVAAPCFVTTLRHPLEVIMSKQIYYGEKWHPNNRVAGWLNTMLYTERATRGSRRAIVRYDDLLSDFMSPLVALCERLDLALVERSTPAQARAAARLVDPSLRRARATWDSLDVEGRLVELAEATYDVFDRASNKTDIDNQPIKDELDELRQQYVELYEFAESVAESSIVAGKRGGGGKGGGKPPVGSVRSMRRLWRRGKGKIRRTVYRARSKNTGPSGSSNGSAPEAAPEKEEVGTP